MLLDCEVLEDKDFVLFIFPSPSDVAGIYYVWRMNENDLFPLDVVDLSLVILP